MDLKIIFLAILGVVSVVYLISLFFKQGIFQAVLKGCLVPLILALYIFSADKILWLIVLGLVLGWTGDILLLKISNLLFFRLGLASFLIGHICYIIAILGFARPFNITVLVISVIAAACLGLFIFKFIRPTAEMKIPVIAYETILLTMTIFAVQLFLAQGSFFGAFVLAGSAFFVVSDSILAFDTFRKGTKYGFFIVMLTYITAQLLIALGFCTPGI
jgi:uncharacterized membrane protein YhhN